MSVRAGRDPIGDREQERDALTVKMFTPIYIQQYAQKRKKSWQQDKRRLDRYVVPALGRHKLTAVTRLDIQRLCNRIGETKPYEANRVLALVSGLFSYAKKADYVKGDFPNPAKYVERFPEKSRARFIEAAEMPAVFKAIDEEADPYIRAAFKLYLFTGLRRSELLGLKWSDVDLAEARLRLAETKNGEPHRVPLSPPAVEILEALPRRLGNDYVLAGHVRGKPLVNVSKPWKRIRARVWLAMNPTEATTLRAKAESEVKARKAASKNASGRREQVEAHLLELADKCSEDAIRIHDIRRTTGSWLAMSGESLLLIAKVLNNPSAVMTYARFAEDAPRAALDALAEKMLAAR